MKVSVRQSNFRNAQQELQRVVQQLKDIELLYLKPMKLHEEINALGKADGYIGKAISRLTKRIELSTFLNKKK